MQPKPGWISTTPGSALHIVVDMNLGLASSPKTIGLTFLSSHEHMGQAQVSCVDGCSCNVGRIDGHSPHVKHAVPRIAEFGIKADAGGDSTTAGVGGGGVAAAGGRRNCTLRVVVASETQSGEHKFKVIQVAVKSWVDMSKVV